MYILFTIQTYKANLNNFKTYILLQDSDKLHNCKGNKIQVADKLIRKCLVPKINQTQMSSVTIRLACEFTLRSFLRTRVRCR